MSTMPLTLIRPDHLHVMGIDAISFGICLKVITKEGISERKLRNRLNEKKLELRSIYNYGKASPNYSLKPIKDTDRSYRLRIYINHLNGYKLLRKFIMETFYAKDHWDQLKRIPATDVRSAQRNFIPIEFRLNPEVHEQLSTLFSIQQPKLFFEELEKFKMDVVILLEALRPELFVDIDIEKYKMGRVEVGLDLPFTAGVNFATDDEALLRMSRQTFMGERALWILAQGEDRLVPFSDIPHEYLRRLFPDIEQIGETCLKGHFSDQTDFYMVTKQKPIPDHNTPIEAQQLWQTRFEKKYNANRRLSMSNVQKIIASHLPSEYFSTETGLRIILDALKGRFHNYLMLSLNSTRQLWTPANLLRAENTIRHYLPNPDLSKRFLTYPYREDDRTIGISTKNKGIKSTFQKGIGLGVFHKVPEDLRSNENNHWWSYNWDLMSKTDNSLIDQIHLAPSRKEFSSEDYE